MTSKTHNNQSEKDFLKEREEKRTKPLVFTRTMGYFRPVDSFNDGKYGEHKERKYFNEKLSVERIDEFTVC